MAFDARSYNLQWMRKRRAEQHRLKLISDGRCPISEILLSSTYHDVHCPCGLHNVVINEISLRIKHTRDGYVPLLVKNGIEVPFDTYFFIKTGDYFEIELMPPTQKTDDSQITE